MGNWLRLRRQSHAPRELDGTETIYAAADGTLMHMDPDGAETEFGAGGGGGGDVPFVGVDPPGSPTDGMLWWDPDDDTAVGGSQAREIVQGNAVTIPDTQQDLLTWDTKQSGDDLLDFANPAVPAVVASGVYAVSVTVYVPTALTAGGAANCQLILDNLNDAPAVNGVITKSANVPQEVTLTLTYYIPAGSGMEVGVTNGDGAQSIDAILAQAVVQRLS